MKIYHVAINNVLEDKPVSHPNEILEHRFFTGMICMIY